ncbi:MAG TPA: hypothetical protein DCM45_07795, partial [Clostridiales bacterium]|nr:hypothetical protein [Clostridiales bacterium]
MKMQIKDTKELVDYCSLLHAVIKMPVLFFQDNGLLVFEISEDQICNPVCDYRNTLFTDIQRNGLQRQPATLTTQYMENFLILTVEMADGTLGFLGAGPSIAHLASGSLDLIAIASLTMKDKAQLNKYYASLPVINYHDLIKIGIFVHYTLFKEVIDFEAINTVSNVLKNIQSSVDHEYNIQYRDVSYLQRSSYFERYFYNLIKAGEVDEMKKLLSVHSLDGEYIVLAKNNPLRSWKNLVICFITISCRAAMEGGLPTETTYALSDVYIQRLEELTTIKDVEDLASQVFIDLTERVRQLKDQQFTTLITACRNYITQHLLSENLPQAVAQNLKVNSSYLSSQFKKEVGIALTDFITDEKIREAKRMLLFTRFS